jgi:hypothetical protein
MINVHMDCTCCHCEKEHLPCALFLPDGSNNDAAYVCCQCLSDAVSAVVAAQMERYRKGEADRRFGQPHFGHVSDGKSDDNGNNS